MDGLALLAAYRNLGFVRYTENIGDESKKVAIIFLLHKLAPLTFEKTVQLRIF